MASRTSTFHKEQQERKQVGEDIYSSWMVNERGYSEHKIGISFGEDRRNRARYQEVQIIRQKGYFKKHFLQLEMQWKKPRLWQK
jgi:hypothetical protein